MSGKRRSDKKIVVVVCRFGCAKSRVFCVFYASVFFRLPTITVADKIFCTNVDVIVCFFFYSAEILSCAVLLLAVTANTEILILEKYLEEAHTLISAQTAPLVLKRKRRWYIH